MPVANPLIELPPFRPHALVPGGHLQTILGNYLPSPVIPPGILHRVSLHDGDHIALHDDGLPPPPLPLGEGRGEGVLTSDCEPKHPLPKGERKRIDPPHTLANHPPVAILLHGLGGCHQSTYMQRCSAKL